MKKLLFTILFCLCSHVYADTLVCSAGRQSIVKEGVFLGYCTKHSPLNSNILYCFKTDSQIIYFSFNNCEVISKARVL